MSLRLPARSMDISSLNLYARCGRMNVKHKINSLSKVLTPTCYVSYSDSPSVYDSPISCYLALVDFHSIPAAELMVP